MKISSIRQNFPHPPGASSQFRNVLLPLTTVNLHVCPSRGTPDRTGSHDKKWTQNSHHSHKSMKMLSFSRPPVDRPVVPCGRWTPAMGSLSTIFELWKRTRCWHSWTPPTHSTAKAYLETDTWLLLKSVYKHSPYILGRVWPDATRHTNIVYIFSSPKCAMFQAPCLQASFRFGQITKSPPRWQPSCRYLTECDGMSNFLGWKLSLRSRRDAEWTVRQCMTGFGF